VTVVVAPAAQTVPSVTVDTDFFVTVLVVGFVNVVVVVRRAPVTVLTALCVRICMIVVVLASLIVVVVVVGEIERVVIVMI
jgi:hypothetical protein